MVNISILSPAFRSFLMRTDDRYYLMMARWAGRSTGSGPCTLVSAESPVGAGRDCWRVVVRLGSVGRDMAMAYRVDA